MTFKSINEQMNIISRNAEEIIPEDELIKKLEVSRKKKSPLIVKLGCDPSRPDLHIGHSVVLRKLRQFQDLGHTAVLVIGDFTAMIGDPSGRNKTRPQLTIEETAKYAKTYVEQADIILDINKLKVVYNTNWLSKMNFGDVIHLASKYTVARMLERDDFTKRFKNEIPISIHELLYPLAQGMDSVELSADIELGGTDQKFNLLVGRDLQRVSCQMPQVIITNPLLEGTDGVEKMSKSYNNHIALNDSPEEMYGKIMSIPDTLILKYFQLAADADENVINRVKVDLNDPEKNPRDLKRKLARKIIELYHDKDAAMKGEKHFDKIFVMKGTPDDIPEISLKTVSLIVDVLNEQKIVNSKTEGRRMIKQNAVRVNGQLCKDIQYQIVPGQEYIIKVGKRRFIKII